MHADQKQVRYIEDMTTDQVDRFLDDCTRAVERAARSRSLFDRIGAALRGVLVAVAGLFRA